MLIEMKMCTKCTQSRYYNVSVTYFSQLSHFCKIQMCLSKLLYAVQPEKCSLLKPQNI